MMSTSRNLSGFQKRFDGGNGKVEQAKPRVESHSTRMPVLTSSPSQACLLREAISCFMGPYRLSQSHSLSNACRISLPYDTKSRHRRIKKQRRYERLASTSQFVDDPGEPKATCDIFNVHCPPGVQPHRLSASFILICTKVKSMTTKVLE